MRRSLFGNTPQEKQAFYERWNYVKVGCLLLLAVYWLGCRAFNHVGSLVLNGVLIIWCLAAVGLIAVRLWRGERV